MLYLCQMKNIFVIFLIVITVSCGRQQPVSKLFRWEKISPETDSLTVALEWAFIEMKSADSIAGLIAKFDSLVHNGALEGKANALFWRARLLNREHKEASAL